MNNMDFFDKNSFYKTDDEVSSDPPNNQISESNNIGSDFDFENKPSSLINDENLETDSKVDNNIFSQKKEFSFKEKLNKTIFDEKKIEKKPTFISKLLKALSTAVLSILLCIGAFLVFYVITTKVAEKNGEYPPYGLFTIISPSMQPNIKVYDVVFIAKVKDYSKLKSGDVITFYTGNTFFNGTPITHRIVQVYKTDVGYKYVTRGDNNPIEDDFNVSDKNIAGKVLFKVPQLGRVQFFLASKGGWFIAILVPALAILAYDLVKIVKLIVLKKKLTDDEDKTTL